MRNPCFFSGANAVSNNRKSMSSSSLLLSLLELLSISTDKYSTIYLKLRLNRQKRRKDLFIGWCRVKNRKFDWTYLRAFAMLSSHSSVFHGYFSGEIRRRSKTLKISETSNSYPQTANFGLRFAVYTPNVNLKLSIIFSVLPRLFDWAIDTFLSYFLERGERLWQVYHCF